jgi:hypothetical protein
MQAKNILVAKNYTITDHTKWYADRSSEAGLAENYTAMEQLCVASAHKYVKNLDEVIVFRGEADNIRDVFKKNFYEIHELWRAGNNILYVDLDVMFINHADYFNQFDQFSMFNLTDPVSTTDEHYGVNFSNYFNCGIRYYPANMDQAVWDLGIQMVENWNPDRWDSEQIIYNAMMFSQKQFDIHQVYQPKLAFQMLHADINHPGNRNFNQIKASQASAVHLHGSRSSSGRLQTMELLSKGALIDTPDNQVLYL